MKNDTQPRAPAARTKLEQAERVLAGLSGEVALLALAASEGDRAAEKALAAHRSKVEQADRQVSDLTAAVELAERLDRQTEAAAAVRMRAEQLERFMAHAVERDRIVAEMCDCIDKLAAAYSSYLDETSSLGAAVPRGASLPVMAMGNLGELGSAYGDLLSLLGAEAFRLSATHRGKLPFARPPGLQHNNPRGVAPGADTFRAATAQVVKLVKEQIAAHDAAEEGKAA